MSRRVEQLCCCEVKFQPQPKFMGGGPRPDWSHRGECPRYRLGWGMPPRAVQVGDLVLIDGDVHIVTRVSECYADLIADTVRAP